MTIFSRRKHVAVALAAMFAAGTSFAALVIEPETFDFGWCPDNAKVSAEFSVKNESAEIIPLTSVQPTCGCTAPNFTPANLAANEATKIGLTFNTRGYLGVPFNKSAKVKTDASGTEYTVYLKGYVVDPQAKIVPDGDGVAGYDPDTKDKHKTIVIKNNAAEPVTLDVVQKTADWAKTKLSDKTIKPGSSVKLEVTVDAPYTEVRTTSLTLEAKGATVIQRLTLAVRTGAAPAPMRMVPPAPATTPASTPSVAPAGSPAATKPPAKP